MTSIPRSYLFVPGDRPDRYPKAMASAADAVIIDLEDAVAPEGKHAARESVREWLQLHGGVVIRINSRGTRDFDLDLELCRTPGVSAIVVPKAERTECLALVAEAAPQAMLLPLIETAVGIEAMGELAKVMCVARLLMGTVDLQLDLGIRGDRADLSYFRSRMVLASRLANLPAPVDGPCVSTGDAVRLGEELDRARQMGCGAKLCIHPNQVPSVNAAFTATAGELDWARRVVEAFEQARGGVVSVDGKMVDRPVLLMAMNLLAQSPPG